MPASMAIFAWARAIGAHPSIRVASSRALGSSASGAHVVVDHAHLKRALGVEARGGEDHLLGARQADEARQALRAASARDDAELELGQADASLAVLITRMSAVMASSRPPPKA